MQGFHGGQFRRRRYKHRLDTFPEPLAAQGSQAVVSVGSGWGRTEEGGDSQEEPVLNSGKNEEPVKGFEEKYLEHRWAFVTNEKRKD